MIDRTTPDNIKTLNAGEIFVFGSNVSGRHGKGAAKTALKWGAIYGRGNGIQGRTYGIPTVNASVTNALPLSKIEYYVNEFIEYARKFSGLTFLTTEVGCGLAGHSYKDIAPLFHEAVNIPNIYLPKRFWRVLQHR